MRRALVPALLCAAALSACGSSGSTVATFAAYHGPPVPAPVPVSSDPQLRRADALCATVIPGLRASIRTIYTLDPESLSLSDLQARAAAYTADAAQLSAFARRLALAVDRRDVRALAYGLRALAAGLKVAGRSVGNFATLGGNANVPGAQAAIESDVGSIVPYALIHKLPDCAP